MHLPHQYHINVFWSDEDDCWIADVPDLKPCSAHGDTPEEAIAEIGIVIKMWEEFARDRNMQMPDALYRLEKRVRANP
jgi:predicted RNase H-like HicB family nuclease